MSDFSTAGGMFSRPLTIHKLPRWVAAGSSAVVLAGLHNASPIIGLVGGAGVVLSAAADVAVQRFFPMKPVRRFADQRDEFTKCGDQHAIAELAHAQHYHVGTRHVPGDRGNRPHMTVFYPTDAPPSETEMPCYVPFADSRFSKGFTDYGNAPAIAGAHQVDIRMAMTRNAALARDAAGTASTSDVVPPHKAKKADATPAGGCKIGTPAHPIIVFSHGLAGHQHMYAAYAADLAANGAIVLALQHTDGSACFALEQPQGTADGATVPASQQEPITYRKPPPSGTEAELEFRQNQILRKRIPEIQQVMRFISGGRLHDALHCPAGSFAAQYGGGAGKKRRVVPVSLVGHSFGAATVVAAAALHPARVSSPTVNVDGPWMSDLRDEVAVTACIALDCWAYPVHPWLRQALEGAKGPLPPLAFHDSQHWERWTGNKAELEEMVGWWAASGGRAERTHKAETDHLTLSVISDLVNINKMRRQYTKPHKDRVFVAEWARDALAFIRGASRPTV